MPTGAKLEKKNAYMAKLIEHLEATKQVRKHITSKNAYMA
jgi:hypothetical protein